MTHSVYVHKGEGSLAYWEYAKNSMNLESKETTPHQAGWTPDASVFPEVNPPTPCER
jgi:hypothetical protein